MKKILAVIFSLITVLSFCAFGCKDEVKDNLQDANGNAGVIADVNGSGTDNGASNSNGGNSGSNGGSGNSGTNGGSGSAGSAVYSVDFSATASVTKTNVGIFLYATSNISGATNDFVFENGSKTTVGASIGTLDGKQYFRATQEGNFVIKVNATNGVGTATATKTVTVSDDTVFSSIYANKYSPDTGHPSYPSRLAHTVVGQGEYYYDNNGSAENSVCFQDLYVLNGNQAYENDFELNFSIKLLPQTENNAESTIFFDFYSGEHRLGDGEMDLMKITRGGTVTIAKTTLTGTLNLNTKTYIKLQRLVATDGSYKTTYNLYTSNNGVNYTLFGSAEVAARDGNYDCWGITGYSIFSQTPLMLGSYTVGSPTI
ncbi:MAG: hypothetical protein IJR66_03330 [Clostridia bacterium]|nr:hypothetical protein [Clostridia bacterium]